MSDNNSDFPTHTLPLGKAERVRRPYACFTNAIYVLYLWLAIFTHTPFAPRRPKRWKHTYTTILSLNFLSFFKFMVCCSWFVFYLNLFVYSNVAELTTYKSHFLLYSNSALYAGVKHFHFYWYLRNSVVTNQRLSLHVCTADKNYEGSIQISSPMHGLCHEFVTLFTAVSTFPQVVRDRWMNSVNL